MGKANPFWNIEYKLKGIDLLQESNDYLIVIFFFKSNSPNYSEAVKIAKLSKNYREDIINNKTCHLACFESGKGDIITAHLLLELIFNWKNVYVFAKGRKLNNLYSVKTTLDCYIKASSCKDWRAHCFIVVSDPFRARKDTYKILVDCAEHRANNIDQYIFPCKELRYHFYYMRNHPSSIQDQLQAKAVDRNCDWCPFFDPNYFGQVE